MKLRTLPIVLIIMGIGTFASLSWAESYKPFTIKTYNQNVTFKAVPKRVVSLNAHTSEILLALGLGHTIVGTAYNNAEVLPQYRKEMDRIPRLAEKYPSMEILLSADPDFVYGRSSAFKEKAVGTLQTVLENGIAAYVCKGSYTAGATIEDTYTDIHNLGRIFNIQSRSDQMVNGMKTKIAGIHEKVKQNRPVRVFVFDFGGDTAFTACQSLQTNLIELAGGKNIFDDIEKTWAKVSWEQVVERDPEIIVINEYGETPTADKLNELKTKPALANVSAVKNNRFCVIKLPAVFPGVRNADTVEEFAKCFYPELFK